MYVFLCVYICIYKYIHIQLGSETGQLRLERVHQAIFAHIDANYNVLFPFLPSLFLYLLPFLVVFFLSLPFPFLSLTFMPFSCPLLPLPSPYLSFFCSCFCSFPFLSFPFPSRPVTVRCFPFHMSIYLCPFIHLICVFYLIPCLIN